VSQNQENILCASNVATQSIIGCFGETGPSTTASPLQHDSGGAVPQRGQVRLQQRYGDRSRSRARLRAVQRQPDDLEPVLVARIPAVRPRVSQILPQTGRQPTTMSCSLFM